MFRLWLLELDHAAIWASSSGMVERLEAGTIRVASSAYLIIMLRGVTGWRSDELVINKGEPIADPSTTLVLIPN